MYSSAKRSGVGCESASRNRTIALRATSPPSATGTDTASENGREGLSARAATTVSTAIARVSAPVGHHLNEGRTTRGAVSRAPRQYRSDPCYGPVQASVVMSPPGPRLYQAFVPTWLLRQYDVVLAVPTIGRVLACCPVACIF